MDYITAQTPDKGVQIGPEPPISNDSIALTPDKGVQIGKELPIIDASIALTPDKGVQIGPEPPISNGSIAMEPDKGVQIGPELPISNDSIAMTSDTTPGFAGNLIEAGMVINGTKSAVYTSTAYPANADGTQRPGAVVEYSSEFSVGEGFAVSGEKSELPAGYLQAEFLESTGTQHIDTKLIPNDAMGVSLLAIQTGGMNKDMYLCGVYENSGRFYPWLLNGIGNGAFFVGWNSGTQGTGYFYNAKTQVQLNYKNNRKFVAESNESRYELAITQALQAFTLTMPFFSARNTNGYTAHFVGKLYAGSVTEGTEKVAEFIPAITNYGVPCLRDTITQQTFYNLGTGQFIVGFTLVQARKLGKHLPEGGGTLTISLPTGYDSDAGVATALETARAKGWTLTIQTYTPENATKNASTFALKRIWVRRTQDEQGTYVDVDGSRWQVDWCVDMITPDGSTPDAYGYEMFRNIDAATEYWELTPYVDPEAEEEFLQEA